MKNKNRSRSPRSTTLNIELARAGITQTQLAQKLELPPTTLSTWLRGSHPPPDDLMARIEKVLGLSAGTLSEEVSDGR